MATRPNDPTTGASADELEQRQRPDGTIEEPGTVGNAPDTPLSPDELEQRQRLDGSIDVGRDEAPDGPVTADVLEQHTPVGDDDLDDDLVPDDRED